MRKMTILAAGAALALASAASAQEQPAAPPATAPAAPATPDAAVPTIQTISIVDINELPEATKTQVNTIVSQRSEADLQKLRSSIDATPEVQSALKAKGLTSEHVIAASMSPNGALTLVTKKAG